jgi:hypothetical protein
VLAIPGKVVIATKFGSAYDENGEQAGLSIRVEYGSSRPPPADIFMPQVARGPERTGSSRSLPALIGSALG